MLQQQPSPQVSPSLEAMHIYPCPLQVPLLHQLSQILKNFIVSMISITKREIMGKIGCQEAKMVPENFVKG